MVGFISITYRLLHLPPENNKLTLSTKPPDADGVFKLSCPQHLFKEHFAKLLNLILFYNNNFSPYATFLSPNLISPFVRSIISLL